jgi:hypothetical protein
MAPEHREDGIKKAKLYSRPSVSIVYGSKETTLEETLQCSDV